MIEALEFKRHKAAASLFVAFNVLGVLIWIVGIALTAGFLAKTDSAPPGAAMDLGYFRNAAAGMMFIGYLFGGLFCIFLSHVIRYLAAIAEATGKHALAYLDVVAPRSEL